AVWRWTRWETRLPLGVLWLLAVSLPALCCLAGVPRFSDCPATLAPSTSWLAKLIAYNPLLRLPEFLLGIALCRLFVLKKQSAADAGRMLSHRKMTTDYTDGTDKYNQNHSLRSFSLIREIRV